MRILRFKGENFKRLSVVEIQPDGNLVPIRGLNEQGKTSVLDGIWTLIKGMKDKHVVPIMPIREGQEVARLYGELGERGERPQYCVTRTFRLTHEEGKEPWAYTTELKVTDADGLPFKAAQSVLDALTGDGLNFDPVAFLRMKPDEQFDVLAKFVPGVDFEKFDRQYEADYQRRAAINKQAEQVKARADIIVVSDDPPAQRVDESAIAAQLKAAGDANAELEQRRASRERMQVEIREWREDAQLKLVRADELRRQAAALEQQASELTEQAEELERILEAEGPLGEPIDTTALLAQLQEAQETNRRIDEWQKDRDRKQELLNQWRALVDESKAITAAMQAREKEKQDKIAAAKMPVAGLGFGKRIVLLNGVPFSQASDAVRLRTAVAIAMAMNPVLRIIRIRDGEKLDRNNLKLIEEMAREAGYDIWIELVGDEGETGFILEDGRVKEHRPAKQVAA